MACWRAGACELVETVSLLRAGAGSVCSLLQLQSLARNTGLVNICLIDTSQAHPFPTVPTASLGDRYQFTAVAFFLQLIQECMQVSRV